MRISEAHVGTEHAVSYLRQLCRHWSHRFPVQFTDEQGTIQLPSSLCLLQSKPDRLDIRLELAEGGDQPRIEEVVAEHLQRFGFREQLVFDWQRSENEPNSSG